MHFDSPSVAICTVYRTALVSTLICMVQMDALCDQGCRPVGQPATVTSSHGGTILQLNHQTALLVVSLLQILITLSYSFQQQVSSSQSWFKMCAHHKKKAAKLQSCMVDQSC